MKRRRQQDGKSEYTFCCVDSHSFIYGPKSQTLCPLYTLETSNYCPFTSLIPLKESYGKDKFLVRFKAEMRVD